VKEKTRDLGEEEKGTENEGKVTTDTVCQKGARGAPRETSKTKTRIGLKTAPVGREGKKTRRPASRDVQEDKTKTLVEAGGQGEEK